MGFDLADTGTQQALNRFREVREQSNKEAGIVEQVTGDITVEDEFEMAIELANKRIVRMANLEFAVRQRRLNSYLARKGYSSSIVIAAVKQAELNLGNSD